MAFESPEKTTTLVGAMGWAAALRTIVQRVKTRNRPIGSTGNLINEWLRFAYIGGEFWSQDELVVALLGVPVRKGRKRKRGRVTKSNRQSNAVVSSLRRAEDCPTSFGLI